MMRFPAHLVPVVLALVVPSAYGFIESSDLRGDTLNKHDIAFDKQPRIALYPGEDTTVVNNGPLSLGEPIEFETSLFKGKILIRLRNAHTSDPESHAKYFQPSRKTRLMQSVVQGQFKRAVKMSEIYVGSILNQPLQQKPPAFVTKVLERALRQVQPGAIVDIGCHRPKVMALYAGTAQSVSIDIPGLVELPDILAPDFHENVAAHLPFGGSSDRRMRLMSQPQHASNYEFDTNHVYTLHSYNEFIDFGTGTIKVPLFGLFDLKATVGDQPFKISAVSSRGETLYSFEIRH